MPRLKIVVRSVDDLLNDPTNARTHSNRNIEAIQASLRRFDMQKPLVIDERDIVIAGNGTLVAAKNEGWEWIECIVSKLTGNDARAYGLADNRTAEMADWDQGVLMETLEMLDPSLQLDAGWTAQELEKLFSTDTPGETGDAGSGMPGDSYGVIVQCETEEQQRSLMDKLDAEGFTVRALIG